MINAQTSLGRALQRVRLLNRLAEAEKFLRDNNKNDLGDTVKSMSDFVCRMSDDTILKVNCDDDSSVSAP